MNKIDEILNGTPEKNLHFKDTTSLKWKRDFLEFFIDKKLKSCLEIGTHQGLSTRILSSVFGHVWTVESNEKRWKLAKEYNSNESNITFILGDAYVDETYSTIPTSMDVVFIDCGHDVYEVLSDIERAIALCDDEVYIVFDDYGHPETGVKEAIEQSKRKYNIETISFIGQEDGFFVTRKDGSTFQLEDNEGIIMRYSK